MCEFIIEIGIFYNLAGGVAATATAVIAVVADVSGAAGIDSIGNSKWSKFYVIRVFTSCRL